MGVRVGVSVVRSPNQVLPRSPGEVMLEVNIERVSRFPEHVIALVTVERNAERSIGPRGKSVVPCRVNRTSRRQKRRRRTFFPGINVTLNHQGVFRGKAAVASKAASEHVPTVASILADEA